MTNYFQGFFWFLSRPRLYPQFTRLVLRKLSIHHQSFQRSEVERWCEERAITRSEAVAKITGKPMHQLLRDLYPVEFAEAERKKEQCPVQMGGPTEIDVLYWVAEHLQATRVIETGVAYGWSSLAILLSLQKRPSSKLISTDMPYINRNNDRYVGCVVNESLRKYWQIIPMADREGLPRAMKQLPQIDMCHYDSDKSVEGRCFAYPLLWNALREGGWLISDDINDNFGFRDFCEKIKQKPLIVRSGNVLYSKREGYIGLVRKPPA